MSTGMTLLHGLGSKVRKDERQDCGRSLKIDLPTSTSVDIEFENITFKVSEGIKNKKTKTILREVSGVFRSGELTAIMGPSGAGKSSLMNALTGFSTNGVTGTIQAGECTYVFGGKQNASTGLNSYRKKSCYILQDDRLNPLFTVSEIMEFATEFKLGNCLSSKLKQIVIDEILLTLSLKGTENTRCANLSGGQRKRLSIALELIDNPPVVFLDEPTTGLDSLSSAQCIDLLKSLAQEGRTVVCTIHQPTATVYALFDQVYVLADGFCIYQGASDNTVPFLASVGLRCPVYHNPADYILEVANGEYGKFNELLAIENTKQDWRKKTSNTTNDIPLSDALSNGKSNIIITPPSEFCKFFVLLQRCLIQQYRDWTVTHLKVLLHLCIGILLGVMFQSAGNDGSKTISNCGYMMITLAYLTYTSLMPAVLRFPQELPVLKKENFNNWYKLRTYYAAVLVTGIPIQIWYSVVYCGASYFLSGQPLELSRFLMFTLICTAVTLLSDALGNVIGTCVNPINGTFLGAILTCAMVVFAGYLAMLSHMNIVMRTISHGSFLRYSFEGLVLALYSYDRPLLDCPDTEIYCHYRIPKLFIDEFSFKHNNYWFDMSVLVIELVIFRFVAYWTLNRNIKKSS